MGISIYKKSDQASGSFNSGEILEKKPIGFPNDGGKLKPYSNIFYWAHAWTPQEKSTIGLHPHRGFEICSFVLKGKINHFDTKQNRWIPLEQGDVQVIRSGNGISHSEEICDSSEIFQIWFDPDLTKTLIKEASYSDYKSTEFPVSSIKNKVVKNIIGNDSPVEIDSEGVIVNEYLFGIGDHLIDINEGCVHSVFLMEGILSFNGAEYSAGTFFTAQFENYLQIKVLEKAKVFEITSPY
ncbi:MAG: pirin family protein [Flavobacteriaceae bacterium]